MHFYRRSASGPWWVKIGRKTRKSTGTTDRQAAEEFGRALEQRLWRRDKLGDRSAISWREAADRWLTDSTRERRRDREFLAWLDPKIGEEAVSDIADPDAIEELRKDGLAEGWSRATVDRMLRTVRAVLRACVRWRHLESVPHIPQYGEDDPEPRFLTKPQFARLCRELPPHLNIAARFAVATLLRSSAQAGLTWDRVDLKARRAWVPRGQMKGKRAAFGFVLSPEAVKLLRQARRLSPTGNHVFQYDGQPIGNFNRGAFQKAARRAGVPGLRWHDLRHTGASWAVQCGVTLPELMVLGGWKSYRMVLRYAHLTPQNAAAAAQVVGTNVAQALKRKTGS